MTGRYFRFTFDYDAGHGGYVRGSLRQTIIPRPNPPEPEPDPWLGVL